MYCVLDLAVCYGCVLGDISNGCVLCVKVVCFAL